MPPQLGLRREERDTHFKNNIENIRSYMAGSIHVGYIYGPIILLYKTITNHCQKYYVLWCENTVKLAVYSLLPLIASQSKQ